MNLIFDLDGTLIDSLPDIQATAAAVLEPEGLSAPDLPTLRGYVGWGLPHLVGCLLRAHGITDPARAARLQEAFHARYSQAVTLTRPYPGVPETLAQLRGAGHRLAICTNKPETPARAILTHLGLADLFDRVIGGDSAPARKPDPAPLRLALGADQSGPAWLIGDTAIDSQTAANAGLPFALFTQGYRHSPIAEIPHHAAFDAFTDLPALLG